MLSNLGRLTNMIEQALIGFFGPSIAAVLLTVLAVTLATFGIVLALGAAIGIFMWLTDR